MGNYWNAEWGMGNAERNIWNGELLECGIGNAEGGIYNEAQGIRRRV